MSGNQIRLYSGQKGYELLNWSLIDDHFGNRNKWDEDVAKCMLFIHLKQGGILRIRRDSKSRSVTMDGTVKDLSVYSAQMISAIIKKPLSDLEAAVRNDIGDGKFKMMPQNWIIIPGVSKIKIYCLKFSDTVCYSLTHKTGKDGTGKNYHLTGTIELNGNHPKKGKGYYY